MTVTILSLSARKADSVSVTFELRSGEESERRNFLLTPGQVADLQLCRGETTTECFDAVSYAAEVYAAKKRAAMLLGYGGCSPSALCRKLISKGIEREIAREAVEQLLEQGLFDPSADARREAERGVAKGWGRKRIAAALGAKGYSVEVRREALEALEEAEVDFVALCAQQIRKKVDVVPSEPVARQRLIASLERLGYSASEIREAFRVLAK